MYTFWVGGASIDMWQTCLLRYTLFNIYSQQGCSQVNCSSFDGDQPKPAGELEKILPQEEVQAPWPSTQEDPCHEEGTDQVWSEQKDRETKKEGDVQSSPCLCHSAIVNICTHHLAMVDQTDCGGVILCIISCELLMKKLFLSKAGITSSAWRLCVGKIKILIDHIPAVTILENIALRLEKWAASTSLIFHARSARY